MSKKKSRRLTGFNSPIQGIKDAPNVPMSYADAFPVREDACPKTCGLSWTPKTRQLVKVEPCP
jgi:hypothetical protein